jgi:fibrillarin-like pre-rRNA processing protein
MRSARRFERDRRSPRLVRRRFTERTELWTETVGTLPPVYGERWTDIDGTSFRTFEPFRSKLAAGLSGAWDGPLPRPGERWLYLGAASGTTASHVADLVGPGGRVYAVERSLRPFARLVALGERWPSLSPVLGDARSPDLYADLVPPVDGLYADIAQPDQVEIVRRNAELFLSAPGAAVILALKTASMGRERTAPRHREVAETALAEFVELAPAVRLDPFHRAHYLVGGRWSPETSGSPPATRPAGSTPGRRRR